MNTSSHLQFFLNELHTSFEFFKDKTFQKTQTCVGTLNGIKFTLEKETSACLISHIFNQSRYHLSETLSPCLTPFIYQIYYHPYNQEGKNIILHYRGKEKENVQIEHKMLEAIQQASSLYLKDLSSHWKNGQDIQQIRLDAEEYLQSTSIVIKEHPSLQADTDVDVLSLLAKMLDISSNRQNFKEKTDLYLTEDSKNVYLAGNEKVIKDFLAVLSQ